MLKRIFYSSIVVLVTACTATINTTTNVSYIKENFTRQSIHDGGLALLPITAGAGLEGFRRPFGNALNAYVDTLGGGVPYTGWQSCMNKLNEADLAEDYNNAINNYNQTSIIEKSFLQKMGETVGTRYFLFIQLGTFEESTNTSYNIFTGLETTKTNEVSAYAQIWDARNGDVVWEALANAEASSSSSMVKVSDDPNKYSNKLAKGIANELF